MHLEDFDDPFLQLSIETIEDYVEKFGHTFVFWHKFNDFLVKFKIPEEKFLKDYYSKFKKYKILVNKDYIGYFISQKNASKLYSRGSNFIVKLPFEQFKKEYINLIKTSKYEESFLYYFKYNKISEKQIDEFLKEIEKIKYKNIDKLSSMDTIFNGYLRSNQVSEKFIEKWFSEFIKYYPLDIYLSCKNSILSYQDISEKFILKFYDNFKYYLDELNNNCYMDKEVRQKFLNLLQLQKL